MAMLTSVSWRARGKHAPQVLKDCKRKHDRRESKYETLADAISERLRGAVGEHHWRQARRIQKVFERNRQKKKVKAMLAERLKVQQKQQQQRVQPLPLQRPLQQRETIRPQAAGPSSRAAANSDTPVLPTQTGASRMEGLPGLTLRQSRTVSDSESGTR